MKTNISCSKSTDSIIVFHCQPVEGLLARNVSTSGELLIVGQRGSTFMILLTKFIIIIDDSWINYIFRF